MKGLIAKIILLVVTVMVTLVLVEQVLRAVDYEYRAVSIEVINTNDARLFHLFDDSHFEYDPALIWRPKKAYEFFNAQGFRGPELAAEKAAGERRVFTIGDSNTLGWAGLDGPNWPADLGERLRKRDPAIQVVNAGVWGYSSYQGRERLKEVLPYEPDLVLVSFGANDAHVVPRGDRQFAAESLFSRESERWGRWLLHFRLSQLAAAAWDGLVQKDEGRTHRVELDEYRQNLRDMVQWSRDAGADVALLTRPFYGPVRKQNWWKEFAPDYNRATVEIAEEQGVLVIDVYTLFKADEKFFSDESHFTREGHRRAADFVAAHLRPWVKAGLKKRRAAR